MAQSTDHKTARNHYPDEFRELALALRIGVAKAARELSLHESQLYAWRKKQQQALTYSEQEQQQLIEIAKLKCQLAEQAEELAVLQKAATYFAKRLK